MRTEWRRHRAGKSLIEMLVVIATMSAILTLATQLLSRLSQSERVVRKETVAGQAQIRFARQFRNDARTADFATLVNGDGTSIKFSKSREIITYEATADRVIRTRSSNPNTHRDAFTLGEVDVTFQVDGTDWAIATSIRRSRDGRSTTPVSVEFQVVAKVAADAQKSSTIENPLSDIPARQKSAMKAPPVEAPKPTREDP